MLIIKSQKKKLIAVTEAPLKLTLNWHWLALMGIIVAYLILAYLIPPGSDTLWRLHIASLVLDGKTLYRDVIEVNPPLWFWGAIPAAFFDGYLALVAINLVASLIGIALFGALALLTLNKNESWAAVLGLALGLLLVNVAEIGQREQSFLLACALWSGMAAARMEGKAVPIWLVLLASSFSAYGFALKHYFVIVPVAIEALVLWRKRLAWRPFRLENLILAGLALAYGFAVLFFTPDFLGRVFGLVQASYYGFGPWNSVGPIERQLRLILQCAFVIVPLIALVLTGNKSVLVWVLLVPLFASIVIVVLQQKGWRYHLIGANGLAIIMVAVVWQSIHGSVSPRIVRRFVPLGLGALAWTAIGQPVFANIKTHGQAMDAALQAVIAKEPPSHQIAILSTAPEDAFLLLARSRRKHWSRHFSMWMMPGLLTPQSDPKREVLRVTEHARVLKEFTSDLMCTAPEIIFGEVGYYRNPERRYFDAMAFLREDRAFAMWIDTNYVRAGEVENHPIWRLSGPKPAPQNCTKPR
jgi:hypothetical protein